MAYYIENTKTGLGKYLNWFEGKFNAVEWVEIYNFYTKHSSFTITVINE